MKIKLLAATLLILALGINTTEAQNRQRSRAQKQNTDQYNRGGEYSKSDRGSYLNKRGDYRSDNRKYKNKRMMKYRHRKDYRRYHRHFNPFFFPKKHHRTHRY